jgi:hypothetical protein
LIDRGLTSTLAVFKLYRGIIFKRKDQY